MALQPARTLRDLKPVLKGALTWIPGVQRAFYDQRAAGGTAEAQYCYGVWMKHLSLLWRAGMRTIPAMVAELGPGKSLGCGLAALLSGVERYAALDVVRHASMFLTIKRCSPGFTFGAGAYAEVPVAFAPPDRRPRSAALDVPSSDPAQPVVTATVANTTTGPLLEPISALFRSRAPRPPKGWPDYDDMLDERLFPSKILTDERLSRSLAAPRLAELTDAVRILDAKIQHPWLRYGTWRNAHNVVVAGEADLVFSHVVLSVVEDQEGFYQWCSRWLKPGGWMSHQIDFSSLEVTNHWNGHLQYSEAVWRIIVGQRPFFVNRARLSRHLALMQKYGFELKLVERFARADGIERSRLAPRWRDMSDDDLTCATAFIVARKPG